MLVGISQDMNVSVKTTGSDVTSSQLIGGMLLVPEVTHSAATPLPGLGSDLTSLTSRSTSTPPNNRNPAVIPSVAPSVPTALPDYYGQVSNWWLEMIALSHFLT